MLVYVDSAVPPPLGGNRHLATVPPGVGGDRRAPGGVLDKGGGGYTTCLCSFSAYIAQKSKFSELIFLIL